MCSLKSGYGFIKRLNIDKEIFFHITQVESTTGDDNESKKIQIGDKVDFSIGFHEDKEVSFFLCVSFAFLISKYMHKRQKMGYFIFW